MFALETKPPPIEYSSTRFKELYQFGRTKPAPNGKENALRAWKRDQYLLAWSRIEYVDDVTAQLLSNIGFGRQLLRLDANLLFKIWQYLASNEIMPHLIMYHILHIADPTKCTPKSTLKITKALEAPGKLPQQQTQRMPKSVLNPEEQKNLLPSLRNKNHQMLEASIELACKAPDPLSIDHHLFFVMNFSEDKYIYRALYFLLSTLINSYGPCGRAWPEATEDAATRYMSLYAQTELCLALIKEHFSPWLEDYPAKPNENNLKTLTNKHIPIAEATLKNHPPPHRGTTITTTATTVTTSASLYSANTHGEEAKRKRFCVIS